MNLLSVNYLVKYLHIFQLQSAIKNTNFMGD